MEEHELTQFPPQIYRQFGICISNVSIYNWINQFGRLVIDQISRTKIITGDTWYLHHDEIRATAKGLRIFDIIDTKTRFLLASKLGLDADENDTEVILKLAINRAARIPCTVLTNRTIADSYYTVIGSAVKISTESGTDATATEALKEWYSLIKPRTKIMRGIKKMDTALLVLDAWLIHYNYFIPGTQ